MSLRKTWLPCLLAVAFISAAPADTGWSQAAWGTESEARCMFFDIDVPPVLAMDYACGGTSICKNFEIDDANCLGGHLVGRSLGLQLDRPQVLAVAGQSNLGLNGDLDTGIASSCAWTISRGRFGTDPMHRGQATTSCTPISERGGLLS